MIHQEFMRMMPDVGPAVIPQTNPPRFIRKRWSYAQAFYGLALPDCFLVFFDGACLGQGYRLPEEVWAARFPLDIYTQPTWHRLFGCDEREHEAYGPSVVETPPSWPKSHRWLCSYTGTMRSTIGQALRQHCGLAWAPDVMGPWSHNHTAIPPRGIVPVTGDWPPGMWPTALLVMGDRVLLVTRDASVPQPLVHEVYEVRPDFSVILLGALECPGLPPKQWLNDARHGDGGLWALEGGDPGQQGSRREMVEWYADLDLTRPWPGVVTMRRSGRTFAHPNPLLYSFDGGYMRGRDGGAPASGETVFASVSDGRGPRVIGSWYGQMWTSVEPVILDRTPVPLEVIE